MTKVVYDAANSLDARIVAGLLESRGVACEVEGEYLQGGMGELPVSGLVRIVVEDADAPAARAIISEHETLEHSSRRHRQPLALWGLIAVAVVLSVWQILRHL